MASTLHFGPEWMRDKRVVKSRAPATSPPPGQVQNGTTSYSAVLTPAIPQSQHQYHDATSPFKYSKEEVLQVWRDGGGNGGLGLEVERWEGVIRESGREPAGVKEINETEKKLFISVNSELRRRMSHDSTATIVASRLKAGHTLPPQEGPLRDRLGPPHGRKKKEEFGEYIPSVPRALSSNAESASRSTTARDIGELELELSSLRQSSDHTLEADLNPWSAKRLANDAFPKCPRPSLRNVASNDTDVRRDTVQDMHRNETLIQGYSRESQLEEATAFDSTLDSSDQIINTGSRLNAASSALLGPDSHPPGSDVDPNKVQWLYLDPTGKVQGPFTAPTMQKWYDQGYFTPDLCMKRSGIDDLWIPLGDLLKLSNSLQFFMSSLPIISPSFPDRPTIQPPFSTTQGYQDAMRSPNTYSDITDNHRITVSTSNSPASSLGHGLGLRNPILPSHYENPSLGGYDLESAVGRSGATRTESPSSLGANSISASPHLSFSNSGVVGSDALMAADIQSLSPFPHSRSVPWFAMNEQTHALANSRPGNLNSLLGSGIAGNSAPNSHVPNQIQGLNHPEVPSFSPYRNGIVLSNLKDDDNQILYARTGSSSIATGISPVQAVMLHSNDLLESNFNVAIGSSNMEPRNGVNPQEHSIEHPEIMSFSTGMRHSFSPKQWSDSSFDGIPVKPTLDATSANNSTQPLLSRKQSNGLPWSLPMTNLQTSIVERQQGNFNVKEHLRPIVPAESDQLPQLSQDFKSITLAPGPSLASPILIERATASNTKSYTDPSTTRPLDVGTPSSPNPLDPKQLSSEFTHSTGSPQGANIGISETFTPPPSDNQSPTAQSLTKPAWSLTTDDDSSGSKPTGPRLREIQEKEMRKTEQRKAIERESRKINRANLPKTQSEEVFTASWGLPISQAGSIRPAKEKEAPSPVTPNSSAPVWSNMRSPSDKKSMKEIQEEEERRKILLKDKEAVTATKRGYAETATKVGQLSVSISNSGGAWTTVGSHGKVPSSSGTSARAQQQNSLIPGSGLSSQQHPITSAVTSHARNVGNAPKIAGNSRPPEIGPSNEFLKWLKEALRGLKQGVNVDDFIQMLLSFPVEASPETIELIQEQAYANSTTIDGRRFASEFIEKRKVDASTQLQAALDKPGVKPTSMADVVRAPQKLPPAEWGYKVVKKRGKGGKNH